MAEGMSRASLHFLQPTRGAVTKAGWTVVSSDRSQKPVLPLRRPLIEHTAQGTQSPMYFPVYDPSKKETFVREDSSTAPKRDRLARVAATGRHARSLLPLTILPVTRGERSAQKFASCETARGTSSLVDSHEEITTHLWVLLPTTRAGHILLQTSSCSRRAGRSPDWLLPVNRSVRFPPLLVPSLSPQGGEGKTAQ